DLYLLSHHMRDICHRLHGVGFVLASEAFEPLPSGVPETLAVLSNQTDHTSRMITRLPSKLDQWDFVDAINRLTYQVETLQWRMTDAVPNSKRGLTYMAAVTQLGQAFVRRPTVSPNSARSWPPSRSRSRSPWSFCWSESSSRR